jgi:hypothetical protein
MKLAVCERSQPRIDTRTQLRTRDARVVPAGWLRPNYNSPGIAACAAWAASRTPAFAAPYPS